MGSRLIHLIRTDKCVPFYGRVAFHRLYVPQPLYPFIRPRTPRLHSRPRYWTALQWTLRYMCIFQVRFPRGICLEVGLLGPMVVLFSVFKGISVPSSTVAASIYIPTSSARVSLFSTLSPALVVCGFFDDGHSEQCEVIPPYSFDVQFSNNEWCWAPFHVFISHSYVFFEEMSV